MSLTPRLSAFLIVRDEASDLPGCLQTLHGVVDDIVVVDSGSSDGTVEIARRHGARVFVKTFEGFGSQKQFALNQTRGEWVFSIDADERLTPELAQEIRRVLQAPGEKVGFEMHRRLFFLGRPLRFGGVGTDWVLRLFRRNRGHFTPVAVHERVVVDGPVGRLRGILEHHSYPTLEEYLAKREEYTSLAAEARWRAGRRFSKRDYLRPGWEYFSRVVLKGAWLDGRPGLTYARLSAHTAWVRDLKLRALQKSLGKKP